MSTWRAKALELFPNLISEIQSAKSPTALWIELTTRLRQHYDSDTDSAGTSPRNFIRFVCLYALWCTKSASPDTQQAAWIGFYEDIPYIAVHSNRSIYKRIIKDLVENIGIEEIERSMGTVGSRLTPDQSKRFLTDAKQAEFERLKRSQKHRRSHSRK